MKDREAGIAYGWLMIAIGIFVILALILIFIQEPLTNGFIEAFNDQVGQGHITNRTEAVFNWNLLFVSSLGTIILLLTLYWSILRALEQRGIT